MTSYILDADNRISPLSENKPRQAIILCHGYGGDGKDISALAINWQRFLPDTIYFYVPTRPKFAPLTHKVINGLMQHSEKEEAILEKSLIAEEKLNTFLDQSF